jgi:hypothetical protein
MQEDERWVTGAGFHNLYCGTVCIDDPAGH